MFDFGIPFSTSQAMTASTTSGRVLMRGGPTGFTLMPTTSFGSMRRRKLSFGFLPVRAVSPLRNISSMTLPSNRSLTSDRLSVTFTTLPGHKPGNDRGVLGTFMKSATLVSTAAGGAWPKPGPASTSPPAVTAEAAPSDLTNSRRLKPAGTCMER